VASLHTPESFAQQIDMLGQQAQSAFRQIDGEEETSAGNEIAPVIGHCADRPG
jgi:hypothetical protein